MTKLAVSKILNCAEDKEKKGNHEHTICTRELGKIMIWKQGFEEDHHIQETW
jgi:hypothetical protein